MHNQKKIRYLTLIEVLISCTLFIIMVTAVFFWIRVSYTAETAAEKSLKQIQEIQCCKLILQRLFGTFPSNSAPQKKPDFFFSTSSKLNPTLYFSCTNGVDPDPQLSNDVFVGIGKNTKNQLILTMWPTPRNEKFDQIDPRTMILLENVSSISWEFLTPPKQGQLGTDTNDSTDPGTWKDHWQHELKKQPLAVKFNIIFTDDSHPPMTSCQLSFPLPSVSQPIPVGT